MNRKSLNEVIKLSDEQKKQIADEVRAFYLDVRGEQMGNLEADYYLLYKDVR